MKKPQRFLNLFLLISAFLIAPGTWADSSKKGEHTHGMGEHEHHTASYGEPGKAGNVDRTIEIDATEFSYEPDSITVKQGQTIRFVVTNTGKLMHEFVIGGEEAQQAHAKEMQGMSPKEMIEHMKHHPTGISVQPGETKELIWKFGPQEHVRYACHVPGHYQAGMIGHMQVQ